MKKEPLLYVFSHCLFFLSILSFNLPLEAQDQDVFYLVDETPVKGSLVEITPKKVKYKGGSGKVRSYDAEEVLIVFNKAGNYLIFPPLQITPEMANDFISASNKPALDLLITLDKKVIPAFIISADEKEVMYQDAQQQNDERSIGKDILAVIIFKNGQHELLVSPSQATEILSSVKGQIENIKAQPLANNSKENNPATKPETDLGKKQVDSELIRSSAGAANLNKAEGLSKAGGKNNEGTALAITEEDLKRLQAVALQKVKDLSGYIKMICNVQTERGKVKQTIDSACALFVDEDARIEVSNIQTGVRNKYKVKDYLNRLSMRPSLYEKIEIEYANINYASDFVKQPDGKYNGEVKYMQTLKGFNNENILYGDMTPRKATVIQKVHKKEDEGISKQSWDVFLSDIGVIERHK